ncbi:MAG: AlkA N-terminal domain-containing protein, partial [Salinisphaeraceae bacterium]|nr:AlkA N-terminal domain-containing protein [Salinisphaeraceae bacterium]
PEASPGTPAWNGTSTTVNRGLRLIEAGALDHADVETLANRLGVGPRHLSRLFQQHLGASPVAIAQTRRLHFAKKLIDETSLPMAEIALAAGFGSIRRFNAVFAKTYQRSPRSLRRQTRGPSGSALRLLLSYRPPYDWPLMRDFLAMRTIQGVEQVEGNTYRRSIQVDGQSGWFALQPGDGQSLILDIHLPSSRELAQVTARIRQQFDLAADPMNINRQLRKDALLAPLIKRHPGLRLPGAWDPFELGVRAILGQQVSVAAARTLAGRTVEQFGERSGEFPNGEAMWLFPDAARLAVAQLDSIGLTRKRAETLQGFARAVASGQLDFSMLQDAASLKSALLALPGIGPWTAEYIAMRALAEPDAFPTADLGLLRATGMNAHELQQRAEAWRPWRAYAAIHLWHS